jgi:hypothetical protein
MTPAEFADAMDQTGVAFTSDLSLRTLVRVPGALVSGTGLPGTGPGEHTPSLVLVSTVRLPVRTARDTGRVYETMVFPVSAVHSGDVDWTGTELEAFRYATFGEAVHGHLDRVCAWSASPVSDPAVAADLLR